MNRQATNIHVQVVPSIDGQWYIRFKRSGKIVLNSETYVTEQTARKIAKNWLKLNPIFVADTVAK